MYKEQLTKIKEACINIIALAVEGISEENEDDVRSNLSTICVKSCSVASGVAAESCEEDSERINVAIGAIEMSGAPSWFIDDIEEIFLVVESVIDGGVFIEEAVSKHWEAVTVLKAVRDISNNY